MIQYCLVYQKDMKKCNEGIEDKNGKCCHKVILSSDIVIEEDSKK